MATHVRETKLGGRAWWEPWDRQHTVWVMCACACILDANLSPAGPPSRRCQDRRPHHSSAGAPRPVEYPWACGSEPWRSWCTAPRARSDSSPSLRRSTRCNHHSSAAQHTVPSHTVHLPLGALVIWCTVRGAGSLGSTSPGTPTSRPSRCTTPRPHTRVHSHTVHLAHC